MLAKLLHSIYILCQLLDYLKNKTICIFLSLNLIKDNKIIKFIYLSVLLMLYQVQ